MWNGKRRRGRDVRYGLAVRESLMSVRLCYHGIGGFVASAALPFLILPAPFGFPPPRRYRVLLLRSGCRRAQ